MNTERLKEIESKALRSGKGKSVDSACIMQMVDYVATGNLDDHPECACPILTEYAIRLNDMFNDEHRQKLKPFIELLISTRTGDAVRVKRKQYLMFRNVTATYPLLLDQFKLSDLAEKLRALANNEKDMKSAAVLLLENKDAIKKGANANANAYAYAYANAYANANAYAYGNAYAYAYAYAYANALREKLVMVSIETLRGAIAITEDRAGEAS